MVAFDLGGVLFDIDVTRYLDQAGRALGVDAGAVARATFDSGIWTRAEVGELDAEGFISAVLDALGVGRTRALERCVAEAWCAIPSLRTGAWALLERLRAPAAAWSNTDALHHRCILGASGLEAALSSVTTSWEIGVEKPSARFFQRALERAGGLQPQRVVYVDDRPDNVAAARALGVDAYVASSLAGVEAGLRARGLLSI